MTIDLTSKKFPELLQDKIANIHELGSALSEYASEHKNAQLIDWLKEVALIDNERSENSYANEGENEAVQLMTLHATKGLEFHKVYILGVEEGLLPHTNSMEDPSELEEERRLLYVGMTRAQKKLYLLTAERRRVLNNWVSYLPSRFLREVPKKYFGLSTEEKEGESANIPTGTKHIKVGSQVYHETFKQGIVQSLQRDFHNLQAIVDFEKFGLRKVDLKKIENTANKDFTSELTYDYNL